MSKPHQPIENYYADDDGKREFIGDLFDKGAPHYDRVGKIGFFGTGHFYRKRAVTQAGLKPGMNVLDVACGTGAVTEAMIEVLAGQGKVTGVDPSKGMLAEAAKKLEAEFVNADAEHLPFEDAQFDFLSMGYALRHVEDLDTTFKEYLRVLKPGGRLLILEISRPRTGWGMFWSELYFRDILPTLSFIITGSRNAQTMMSYYWDTIDACVPPNSILSSIERVGFADVKRRIELGIFSAYHATKPGQIT
ncbi:MAG: class I SAM-dependent methyltransferase [Limisphaerales bacterium]